MSVSFESVEKTILKRYEQAVADNRQYWTGSNSTVASEYYTSQVCEKHSDKFIVLERFLNIHNSIEYIFQVKKANEPISDIYNDVIAMGHIELFWSKGILQFRGTKHGKLISTHFKQVIRFDKSSSDSLKFTIETSDGKRYSCVPENK